MDTLKTFNKTVIEVFKQFKELKSVKFGSRLKINEIQSRIAQGVNVNEEYAIRLLGPVLWNSRERLEKQDTAYFLAYNHDIEVRRLCNQHDVDFTDAMTTVNFMKDAFGNASAEARGAIYKNIMVLIGVYAVYLSKSA